MMQNTSVNMTDFITKFNAFFETTIRKFSLEGDLQNALLYATMNGGKRIRPVLCFIFAIITNKNTDLSTLLSVASSLEAIHCYSLVHDDLPSMDNDDLRRGLLTVHKKYNEATAILVGDALQSMAFEILVCDSLKCSLPTKIKLIQTLSKASGAKGMVNGQFLDMNLEKNFDIKNKNHIQTMHQQKTGALITASCIMGVLTADENNTEMVDNARKIGGVIGELFQLQDDILDITQSTQQLGKTAGKDLETNKPTMTSLMGLENAIIYKTELTEKLYDYINTLECDTDILKKFVDNLVIRKF